MRLVLLAWALTCLRLPAQTTDHLIDALTQIDTESEALNSSATYGVFLADNRPGHFSSGRLGATVSASPQSMRDLVRQGTAALPALIAHLSDARPTRLTVGNRRPPERGQFPFLFEEFGHEYDSKVRTRPLILSTKTTGFDGPYTLKVGDICYALIGQIVNRELDPIRYQPTAGLIINSPLKSPDLIAKTTADWGQTTPDMLKASLLADLEHPRYEGAEDSALTRLRSYFPETYRALTGANLKRRHAFEQRERHPDSQ